MKKVRLPLQSLAMSNKETGSLPLVSIIIPVYNRAALIGRTLDSLAGQVYSNWECIIVDDHSTDNTADVVKTYCKQNERFKLYSNKRTKGAPGARNTGIEYCNGEYIIFLDSDDFLLPHCIQGRIECFTQKPEIDVVVCLQRRLENGIEGNYVNIPSAHHPLVRFFSLHPITDIPWVNNTLLRKSFILGNNVWWDETVKLHQDVQFNLALMINEPHIYWNLNQFDSYWTFDDHTDNIGSKKGSLYEDKLKILEVYYSALQKIKKPWVKNDAAKQYHTVVVWTVLYYISNRNLNFDVLLSFIKAKTSLSKKDTAIIKLIRGICKIKSDFFFKQRIIYKLKTYIEAQYPPVIKKGTFVKLAQLPDKLAAKMPIQ